jgi:hypothetical protein
MLFDFPFSRAVLLISHLGVVLVFPSCCPIRLLELEDQFSQMLILIYQ